MDASDFGNFVAGYEAGAYDNAMGGGGLAQVSAYTAGLVYHLGGDAINPGDPFDLTGIPFIYAGANAAPAPANSGPPPAGTYAYIWM